MRGAAAVFLAVLAVPLAAGLPAPSALPPQEPALPAVPAPPLPALPPLSLPGLLAPDCAALAQAPRPRVVVPPLVLHGAHLPPDLPLAGGDGSPGNPFVLRDLEVVAPTAGDAAYPSAVAALTIHAFPYALRLENVAVRQDPTGLSSPAFDTDLLVWDSPRVHLRGFHSTGAPVDAVRAGGALGLVVECSRFEGYGRSALRVPWEAPGAITVRGSTFRAGDLGPGAPDLREAIRVDSAATRAVRIEGNAFEGPGGAVRLGSPPAGDFEASMRGNAFRHAGVAIAVHLGAAGRTDLQVTGNVLEGAGIEVRGRLGPGGRAVVAANELREAPGGAPASGIRLFHAVEAGGVVEVRDNVLVARGRWPGEGAIDVHVQAGPGTTLVAGNSVEGCPRHGLAVPAGLASPADLRLVGNVVRRCSQAAIAVDRAVPGLEVAGNTLERSAVGLLLARGGAAARDNDIRGNEVGVLATHQGGAGSALRGNAIAGNDLGARNDAAGTLDLRGNWWGAPDGPSGLGPGSGDAVAGNVAFEPWLARAPR